MKQADSQLIVEITPSQIIEIECDVCAVPAGDLVVLESIRNDALLAAQKAEQASDLAQVEAKESEDSAQRAHKCHLQAEDATVRALNSSIDAREDADLSKQFSEESKLQSQVAEQFASKAEVQVTLATAQAAEATIQADRAHEAVVLCEAEITKGENIVVSADAIRIQTQKIHDNTKQLANDALETLDEQTLAIRDEMQALAINIEADQRELAARITADQQQLASTIKADQDQLELNVANHVLPLSVSLIETQTLIAKYHSFN